MQVNPNINPGSLKPTPPPSSPAAKEKAEKSAVRDLFEKSVGVVSAATRIPTNLVSGTLVGGFNGFRRGLDPEFSVDPTHTAFAQVALNTLQGQVQAGVTGFLIGGPVGMATNMVLDAAGAGVGAYSFVKGGSAKEVGRRLTTAVESKVEPGEGSLKGLAKGVAAGATASVKAAAATGFQEGRGTASGLIEGLSDVKKEFGQFQGPVGNRLKQAVRSALGVVGAVLSAPAGAALAVGFSAKTEQAPGPLVRLGIATASGTALGGAIGFAVGGPVGLALGAGIGTVVGLASPARAEEFSQNVLDSAHRARSDNSDLGSEIANKNQSLVQSAVIGAAAGVVQGWNSSVT